MYFTFSLSIYINLGLLTCIKEEGVGLVAEEDLGRIRAADRSRTPSGNNYHISVQDSQPVNLQYAHLFYPFI